MADNHSSLLVLRSPALTISRLFFAIAFHPLAEDIKAELLDLGILEVLIPLTASASVEVQGNAAAAIGNLSSKS